MKKFTKILISTFCAVLMAVTVLFTACDKKGGESGKGEEDKPVEAVDYVSSLSLDFTSNTKKQEVSVRLYIDGDTTHFDPVKNSNLTTYNAADFAETEGYIKARYLAINTPECTGKIEEWGAKAASFTRSKLESAQTIIVESDDDKWNIDSTGERYTLWVWYLPKGATEYRNLNLEILQEGLALGSAAANNRYGKLASNAIAQARSLKLYIYSGKRDPDFYYGAAIPVTLKELRCNLAEYNSKKVKVEGVIAAQYGNSVYIEDLDAETGVYFGMPVYYGYSTGKILEVLSMGNRVSVVGTVSYFEGGDAYQISGVSYNPYDPTLATNSTVISEGNDPAFAETSAKNIVSGTLSVNFEKENEEGEIEIETKQLAYGEAVLSSSVTVKNLTVVSAYTTKEGNSKGAMSLTCQAEDGTTIVVRTEVLKDADGNVITQDKYEGKTITVKGIVDKYKGEYQVSVYRADFITVLD